MGLKARIKWHYEPVDFFEEVYSSEYEGIVLEIHDGEIDAELELDRYESHPEIRGAIEDYIDGLFQGVRLYSHSDFTISAGAVEKERLEGGKNIVISMKPASIVAMAGRIDIKLTDAKGSVVSDTRRERVAANKELAELIASKQGSDQTLDLLLESYSNAVKDPDDELIHLYEIRESLAARFGNKNTAIQTIGLSSNKWSTLGRLANNEPLTQGRHRGKKGTELRSASAEELDIARSIALEMIVLYARILP